MKLFLILSIVAFISACSNHYSENEFDLISIKKAVPQLINTPDQLGYVLPKHWPIDIQKLKPETVFKRSNGIYIKLDSFMTSESGIFIPKPNVEILEGAGHDPSFIYLNHGIYSYVIKG